MEDLLIPYPKSMISPLGSTTTVSMASVRFSKIFSDSGFSEELPPQAKIKGSQRSRASFFKVF
jgi:hypothetical protein